MKLAVAVLSLAAAASAFTTTTPSVGGAVSRTAAKPAFAPLARSNT